jgi:predicted RecB family endonuclease
VERARWLGAGRGSRGWEAGIRIAERGERVAEVDINDSGKGGAVSSGVDAQASYSAYGNLKLTAQYPRVVPDASTTPATNELTAQLQLFYF